MHKSALSKVMAIYCGIVLGFLSAPQFNLRAEKTLSAQPFIRDRQYMFTIFGNGLLNLQPEEHGPFLIRDAERGDSDR